MTTLKAIILLGLCVVSVGISSASADEFMLSEADFKSGWKGNLLWQGEKRAFKSMLKQSTDYRKLGTDKMALNLKLAGASFCVGELKEVNRSHDGLTVMLRPAEGNECENKISQMTLLILGKRLLRLEMHGKKEGIAVAMLEPVDARFELALANPLNAKNKDIAHWVDFMEPDMSQIQSRTVYNGFKRGVFSPSWHAEKAFKRKRLVVHSKANAKTLDTSKPLEVMMINSYMPSCLTQAAESGYSIDGRTLYLTYENADHCEDKSVKMTITALGNQRARIDGFGDNGIIQSAVIVPTKPWMNVAKLELRSPQHLAQIEAEKQAEEARKKAEAAAEEAKRLAALKAEKEKWAKMEWPKSLNGLYIVSEGGGISQIREYGGRYDVVLERLSQYAKDAGYRIGEKTNEITYNNHQGVISSREILRIIPSLKQKYRHCGTIFADPNRSKLRRIKSPDSESYGGFWQMVSIEKRGVCIRPNTSRDSCSVVSCGKYDKKQYNTIVTSDIVAARKIAKLNQKNNAGKNPTYKEELDEVNRTNRLNNGNLLEILNEAQKMYNKQYGR